MDLEELSDIELLHLKLQYLELAVQGREKLRRGMQDTGRPEVSLK